MEDGQGQATLICKEGDIFKLLGEVTKEIGAVKKGGKTNYGDKYEFRRIDDVINAVHVLYGEKGITIVPVLESREREERKTSNGKNMLFTLLLIRYYLVAPDGSYVSGVIEGEGSDTLDKSGNKAMSAALKYFLGTIHLIPFKDTFVDSEDDKTGAQPEITGQAPKTGQDKPNVPAQDTYYGLCPKCSERDIELNTVKKGAKIGKQFLSCPGWKDNTCDYKDWQWPKKDKGDEAKTAADKNKADLNDECPWVTVEQVCMEITNIDNMEALKQWWIKYEGIIRLRFDNANVDAIVLTKENRKKVLGVE